MASTVSNVKFNPRVVLPRDETGRYLHLKLKRFENLEDLTMAYAKKTWQKVPHDGAVDMAPTSRSSCRWCHNTIPKGSLRYQLWLQCHKGCKNSAYFHPDCFFQYPETVKLMSTKEFHGLDSLPETEKSKVVKSFETFLNDQHQIETIAAAPDDDSKANSSTTKKRGQAVKSNKSYRDSKKAKTEVAAASSK